LSFRKLQWIARVFAAYSSTRVLALWLGLGLLWLVAQLPYRALLGSAAPWAR
jgi:lauroyl/myristoyl acyltransferase